MQPRRSRDAEAAWRDDAWRPVRRFRAEGAERIGAGCRNSNKETRQARVASDVTREVRSRSTPSAGVESRRPSVLIPRASSSSGGCLHTSDGRATSSSQHAGRGCRAGRWCGAVTSWRARSRTSCPAGVCLTSFVFVTGASVRAGGAHVALQRPLRRVSLRVR